MTTTRLEMTVSRGGVPGCLGERTSLLLYAGTSGHQSFCYFQYLMFLLSMLNVIINHARQLGKEERHTSLPTPPARLCSSH